MRAHMTCVGMCATVCIGRSKDNLVDLVFFHLYVASEVGLGNSGLYSKHLYLLSYLADTDKFI